MRTLFLRHGSLFLFLALLALLGLTSVVIAFSEFWQSASAQHDFIGDAEVVHYPGLHFATLRSHQFQNYVETLFAKKLRLRHYFIRTHNQFYFSLFKKSFAEQGGVVVGKDDELFQKQYIREYCHPAAFSAAELNDWADDLQKISAFFQKRGITFIYLITPSKAEYKPQALPQRFHCPALGLSPRLRLLDKALQARGLAYVNGPELMERADKQFGVSLFPRGGTHWNWLGAALGAEALLHWVDQKRQSHLTPLRLAFTLEKLQPTDSDADLLYLMNLLHPDLTYLTPQVQLLKQPDAKPRLIATIIGGSFNDNLVKWLTKNHFFAKIHYYYYLRSERTFRKGQKDPLDRKLDFSSAEILKTLQASQVVILEENSSLLAQSEQGKKLLRMMQLSESKRLVL